jgi:hypothetical protein
LTITTDTPFADGFDASTSGTTIASPASSDRPAFNACSRRGLAWNFFGERLGCVAVAKARKLRPLVDIGRDRRERTGDVLPGDRVAGENRRIGRTQCFPGRAVDSPRRLERMRLLERGERATHVLAKSSVDLAWRKPRAIEQHLGADDGGTVRTARHHRCRGGLDRINIELRRTRRAPSRGRVAERGERENRDCEASETFSGHPAGSVPAGARRYCRRTA